MVEMLFPDLMNFSKPCIKCYWFNRGRNYYGYTEDMMRKHNIPAPKHGQKFCNLHKEWTYFNWNCPNWQPEQWVKERYGPR